ncbi:MAG: DUF1801 domain-containing protein [Pirellulales bacterium]|nr:DUF1801 domain-containing protein [Pirellulales bacterium]
MRKRTVGSKETAGHGPPSQPIDCRINAPNDWRTQTLARIRQLIREADPEAVEEVKWRKPGNPAGVPAWSHGGIICTGETYKDKLKLTFAKGASLPDPAGLFNASLDGNTRRAIDIRQGDQINEPALRALVRAAVELNASAPPTAHSARSNKKSAAP